jgi:hypothetical protein
MPGSKLKSYLAASGLTRRSVPGWRRVEEISESLRRLDPSHPVRYDVVPRGLGVLDACPGRRDLLKSAGHPRWRVTHR